MKMSFLTLIVLLLFGCAEKQSSNNTKEVILKDNNELQILRDADQNDRRNINDIDWTVVSKRDSLRRQRVLEMLDSNKVVTAKDYHNAALIFQHGHDTTASRMAVNLMTKAVELDSTINKWLLAAAIDRDLMRRELPQIYGTQYRKNMETDKWYLYEIDTTVISPEERASYGVPSLEEQRISVIRRNQKDLNLLLQSGKSIEDVIAICENEDPLKSEYNCSERSLNNLGYALMTEDKLEDALKIFKLATELYSTSGNTFDSYGECLMALERNDEALAAYKKSIALNPNEYGQNIVDSLSQL